MANERVDLYDMVVCVNTDERRKTFMEDFERSARESYDIEEMEPERINLVLKPNAPFNKQGVPVGFDEMIKWDEESDDEEPATGKSPWPDVRSLGYTKDDDSANSRFDHGDDWIFPDELMMRMDDEKEARGSSGSFKGEDQGLPLESDVAVGTSP
jgi:hypothetical protein